MLGLSGLGLRLSTLRIRGREGGVDHRLQPPPGEPVAPPRDFRVDRSGGGGVVAAGRLGGFAPDPRLHLTGLNPRPEQGEAVAQVEGVADQEFPGVGGQGEDGTELGAGELGHLRGSVASDLEEPFGTGQHQACSLEGAVDVGPVGGDLQHLDVGGL